MRPAWWKDWRGECAAIVASGPSVDRAEVAKLKDRIHVTALKESVDLCMEGRRYFAEIVYGCDAAWWKHRKGLPEFPGLRLTFAEQICNDYPGVERLRITESKPRSYLNALSMAEPGVVGAGASSGFQLFNLLVQFGVRAILLIGVDCNDAPKPHWYGRNNWPGARNPDRSVFPRWRQAFEDAAPILQKMDVDVVNASPVSAIEAFPKMTVGQALERWGL